MEFASMSLLIEHPDVCDFFAYLRLKNLSSRTIAEYKWLLNKFFNSCLSQVTMPADVTFEHLRNYIAGLQARRLSSKTVNDRVIILKRLFGYLLGEGRVASDPTQRLPISNPQSVYGFLHAQ